MNPCLKIIASIACILMPASMVFAQASSGVDADSRFIAIGVNGWHSASPLYGGAETYFATDAMRNLGPQGDYSNIAAYHLIGSSNADGQDYIRQIGDFNSSFDNAYLGQPGLKLIPPDYDSFPHELVSNNQPFISMAKVEWAYRNTIDGEFLNYLSDKSLPGIARAVDVMISDGPQYKDLLD